MKGILKKTESPAKNTNSLARGLRLHSGKGYTGSYAGRSRGRGKAKDSDSKPGAASKMRPESANSLRDSIEVARDKAVSPAKLVSIACPVANNLRYGDLW